MPKQRSARGRKSARAVPYVKGFRRPTEKTQRAAIGSEEDLNTNKWLEPTVDHFQSLPKCLSDDDWLAQYHEEGQTHGEYLQQCPWLSKRKLKYVQQRFNSEGKTLPEKYPDGKLCLATLEEFSADGISPDNETLAEFAQIFLGIAIKCLEHIPLEVKKGNVYWQKKKDDSGKTVGAMEKLKSRFNSDSGHYQLCVDPVLHGLPSIMPPNALAMIALTRVDLYADNTDLFVAGMAAGRKRTALFSLFRYNPNLSFSPEFWYEIKKKKSCDKTKQKQLILLRSCRLLVHELSHLLGLAHCVYFACLMNGAGHLEEDFRQPMFLCPVCLRKLQSLSGFDPVIRYEQLHDFYNKHGLVDEANWINSRLQFIKT